MTKKLPPGDQKMNYTKNRLHEVTSAKCQLKNGLAFNSTIWEPKKCKRLASEKVVPLFTIFKIFNYWNTRVCVFQLCQIETNIKQSLIVYYTFKFLSTLYWYPAVVKENSAATRCINHMSHELKNWRIFLKFWAFNFRCDELSFGLANVNIPPNRQSID